LMLELTPVDVLGGREQAVGRSEFVPSTGAID